MDVAACDRSFGMAHQGRYRSLGEAKVVGHAGEAVAKDVRREILKGSVLDQSFPIFRKADKWLFLFRAGKHEIAMRLGTLSLQQVDNWQTDGSHRCAFFAVAQAKAAVVGVELGQFQIDAFPAPAASKG